MSGTNGTRPWDKWDPSLGQNGQTGLSLFNSTVKSAFCPVCPWDGWGFVPGTIVPQGPSEKCLCVFCLLVFFVLPTRGTSGEMFARHGVKSWQFSRRFPSFPYPWRPQETSHKILHTFLGEKRKGNNKRAKSFRHFFTFFALFHTFSAASAPRVQAHTAACLAKCQARAGLRACCPSLTYHVKHSK